MAHKPTRKAPRPKGTQRTQGAQHAASLQRATKGQNGAALARSQDSERAKQAEAERQESLERDLAYAQSEIGTVARRSLKGSTLSRRAAGIGLAAVLAIGAGTAIGIHEIRSIEEGGSGFVVVEEEEDAGSKVEENTEAEKPQEETQAEEQEAKEEENDEEALGPGNWSTEKYLATMTPATFTQGADGVWRAHIDAQPLGYQKTFADEYLYEVPAELRRPAEPYVMSFHIQRRADVCPSYAGIVGYYYTHEGGERYGDSMMDLSFLRGNDGEREAQSGDYILPFFPHNPYLEEDIVSMLVQSRGVDIDIELLPASQAHIRTWDGQSKIEQNESELFRVTGPITATKLTVDANNEARVFAYRKGDRTFTEICNKRGGAALLSGKEFTSGAQTLEGIELIWVHNFSEFTGNWGFQ